MGVPEAGLKLEEVPLGNPESVSVTRSSNPPLSSTAMVMIAFSFCLMLSVDGEAVIEISFSSFIIKVSGVSRVIPPPVPVKVIVYVPVDEAEEASKVVVAV